MKKTWKKIAQAVMVAALLCPSVGSAEENVAGILKSTGGLVAILGGIAWWVQDDQLDDCKALNAGGGNVR